VGRVADSRAAKRAGERLLTARGSIRGLWNSLSLGWSFDDLTEYLEAGFATIPEEMRGRVLGIVASTCAVVVEQDRDRAPAPEAGDTEGKFVVEKTERGVVAPAGGDRMWGVLDGQRYCVLLSHDPIDDPGGEKRWHVSVSNEAHLGAGHDVPTWRDFVAIVHQVRPGVPFVVGIPPRNMWMNKNPNVLHALETRDVLLVRRWEAEAAAVRGTEAAVPS
jgi:hypothetical protein